MKTTQVVAGVAAGVAAGAIVSAMAAGAMANPSTRRAVKKIGAEHCLMRQNGLRMRFSKA